jgi:hypothetical protein
MGSWNNRQSFLSSFGLTRSSSDSESGLELLSPSINDDSSSYRGGLVDWRKKNPSASDSDSESGVDTLDLLRNFERRDFEDDTDSDAYLDAQPTIFAEEWDFIVWISDFIGSLILYLVETPVATLAHDRHAHVESLLKLAQELLLDRETAAIDRALRFIEAARVGRKRKGRLSNIIAEREQYFSENPVDVQLARQGYERSTLSDSDIREKICTDAIRTAINLADIEAQKSFCEKFSNFFRAWFSRIYTTLSVRMDETHEEVYPVPRSPLGEQHQEEIRNIAFFGAGLKRPMHEAGDNRDSFFRRVSVRETSNEPRSEPSLSPSSRRRTY